MQHRPEARGICWWVLGDCHKEVIEWWTREDARNYQLLLFPRDHGKSRLVAYRVAWELTKDPTLRILYISATANLAEKQLSFIKGILTSEIYRRYWPDHVHAEEGKRTRWTNSEISLDHPLRKQENVRDPSIFTGGLTTSLTGPIGLPQKRAAVVYVGVDDREIPIDSKPQLESLLQLRHYVLLAPAILVRPPQPEDSDHKRTCEA